MKMFAMISAAALGAAAMLAPAAAAAQERVVTNRHVVVTQRSHVERHDRNWNRGHTRRVCKVTYRHHQRVRRCRTVRW